MADSSSKPCSIGSLSKKEEIHYTGGGFFIQTMFNRSSFRKEEIYYLGIQKVLFSEKKKFTTQVVDSSIKLY